MTARLKATDAAAVPAGRVLSHESGVPQESIRSVRNGRPLYYLHGFVLFGFRPNILLAILLLLFHLTCPFLKKNSSAGNRTFPRYLRHGSSASVAATTDTFTQDDPANLSLSPRVCAFPSADEHTSCDPSSSLSFALSLSQKTIPKTPKPDPLRPNSVS